jgi:hypothetical protein
MALNLLSVIGIGFFLNGSECKIRLLGLVCKVKQTETLLSEMSAIDTAYLLYFFAAVLSFIYYMFLIVNVGNDIRYQHFFPEDWGIEPPSEDQSPVFAPNEKNELRS